MRLQRCAPCVAIEVNKDFRGSTDRHARPATRLLQKSGKHLKRALCRARGIRTVAEWTRTIEQMQRLAEDGIDLFQGELLGMPMPPNEVLPQAKPPSTPPKAHA